MEHYFSSEILIRSIGEICPVFNISNITVLNREGQWYPSLAKLIQCTL